MKKTLITVLCLIVLTSFAVAFSLSAAAASTGVVPDKTELRAGDTVTIQITLSNCPDVEALSVDFDIDTDVFEIESGEWLEESSLDVAPNRVKVLMSDFDISRQKGVVTFEVFDGDDNKLDVGVDCNTTVFTITLRALDTAPFGNSTVSCTLGSKDADGNSISVDSGSCVIGIKGDAIYDSISGTTLTAEAVNGETVIIAPSSNSVAMTEEELREMLNDETIQITSNDGIIGTGCTVTIGDKVVSIAVKGDVDGDGVVTVFDALMTKKALADNGFENEPLREYAADVDGKDGTTENDIMPILSVVVGKN